ncbi:MAG: hypothetical protein RJB57_277, partial [Actinomycetota bacterium]
GITVQVRERKRGSAVARQVNCLRRHPELVESGL